MKAILSFTLLLLAAVPVLAAGPADLQPAAGTASGAEESTAQLPADAAWTWALSDTETALETVLFQSDVDATSGCSASTRCLDGHIISCTGENFCFSEGLCFIYCDGVRGVCNNPCF
jgi:hypothetical protein